MKEVFVKIKTLKEMEGSDKFEIEHINDDMNFLTDKDTQIQFTPFVEEKLPKHRIIKVLKEGNIYYWKESNIVKYEDGSFKFLDYVITDNMIARILTKEEALEYAL